MTNPAWPSFTPDNFGPLIGPDSVRDAVKATLKLWTPTYIAAVSRQRGLPLTGDGADKPFQDWTLRPEYRTLPVTTSPAAMVTCLGTMPGVSPQQRGDGKIRADWLAEVSIVVWGTDWEPTEDLTGRYCTAVRAALVQHPSLGGFASGSQWLREKYSELEHSSTRTLGVAVIHFQVTTDEAVNASAGPATVPADPLAAPPVLPTVLTTSTSVLNTPVSRSLP